MVKDELANYATCKLWTGLDWTGLVKHGERR